ncbi:hypothetical protein GCM10010994_03050 [Chelatococcus reniformis]|uniref:Uncharacterized protein n=1 Tax=Chelatococcus reniformis TaxID=1494448 RepID=A0A916TWK3_9HYPH|nr:hypothetical protein GCM10010994_03050 [Chelatococcus reniformis]
MQNLHRDINQEAARRVHPARAVDTTRRTEFREPKRPEPTGLSRAELRKIVIDLIG